MRQFGAFLANLRSSANLSLDELARLVGTSRSTISRIENNEVPLPFKGQYVNYSYALLNYSVLQGQKLRDI